MDSGCTIKKTIEQFALTYKAVGLKSVDSIDLLQPSAISLYLPPITDFIPLSDQCPNKTHFFIWVSLHGHLIVVHNLKVHELVF